MDNKTADVDRERKLRRLFIDAGEVVMSERLRSILLCRCFELDMVDDLEFFVIVVFKPSNS